MTDLVIDLLMPLQVRQLAPGHMKRRGGRATSMHVTCAMFSRQGEIVATYNDEARVCLSLRKLSMGVAPRVLCRLCTCSPLTTAAVSSTAGKP